jgi:hypothetical protein
VLTRPGFSSSRWLVRAAALAIIVGVGQRWPVEVAIALTAAIVIVIAAAPRDPDAEPPVDSRGLPRSIAAVYWTGVILWLLAIGWYVVALFVADDSRDLAAPVVGFLLAGYVAKLAFWWVRQASSTNAA